MGNMNWDVGNHKSLVEQHTDHTDCCFFSSSEGHIQRINWNMSKIFTEKLTYQSQCLTHGACHLLRTSISTAYTKYKQDTKAQDVQPVSLRTFKISGPEVVKLQKSNKLISCVCELCANVSHICAHLDSQSNNKV